MNVIGDIAGQYDTLMALMEKMPEDQFVFVGDIIDRGKKSREVVEWCIAHPEVTVLMGNHEHMMIDTIERMKLGRQHGEHYEYGIWEMNGGEETIQSYLTPHNMLYRNVSDEEIVDKVPTSHIEWMKSLPLYLETDGFFISHAPLFGFKNDFQENVKAATVIEDLSKSTSIIWNRLRPNRHEKIQIFGHNADSEVVIYDRDYQDYMNYEKIATWAVCIDTSYGKKLTGINTKTMETFEQRYI